MIQDGREVVARRFAAGFGDGHGSLEEVALNGGEGVVSEWISARLEEGWREGRSIGRTHGCGAAAARRQNPNRLRLVIPTCASTEKGTFNDKEDSP